MYSTGQEVHGNLVHSGLLAGAHIFIDILVESLDQGDVRHVIIPSLDLRNSGRNANLGRDRQFLTVDPGDCRGLSRCEVWSLDFGRGDHDGAVDYCSMVEVVDVVMWSGTNLVAVTRRARSA